MSAPAISAEDVRIKFSPRNRRPVLAVDGVSFDMHRGERFVILGPSGCGKTTLLMSIAGFLTPVSGVLRSEGEQIVGPGPDRAVVFQDFDQLFPWRTVLNNITYALKLTCGVRGEDATTRARQFLDLVRIGEAADRYPHQLSGGMKQRAAIARALAIDPTVLLMDEPFGAIDEITRTALQKELDRICRTADVTLIMVTHSIQEAVFLGDRVMVMTPGPGSVKDIVDTSSITDLESPHFGNAVAHLRRLLDSTGPDATVSPVRVQEASGSAC